MKNKTYRTIPQEGMMGCGIACVATLLHKTYKEILLQVENGETNHHLRGFYNRELVKVLEHNGLKAKIYKVKPETIYTPGDIVFIRDKSVPSGHYLLRDHGGWIDSWLNYPEINPIKAGVRKNLHAKPIWKISIINKD